MKILTFFIVINLIALNFCKSNNPKLINSLVNLGKSHYIIKYNFPFKNSNKFDWDKFLENGINDILHDTSLNPEIIYHQKQYSFISKNISFNNYLPKRDDKKSNDFFLFKHSGTGNENKLRLSNGYYFSQIINFKNLDSTSKTFVKKEFTYFIDTNFYLTIILPEKLSTIRIKNSNKFKADLKVKYIATIIKAYFVYEKFYPYKNNSNLENLYNGIREILTNKNEVDFIYSIQKMLSFFEDGHSSYASTKKFLSKRIQFEKPIYFPDFNTRIINDTILVSNVSSIMFNKLKPNDIIIEINKTKSIEVIKEKFKYISAATNQAKYRKANDRIFESHKKDSVFKLKIIRNGNIINTEVCSSTWGLYTRQKFYDWLLEINDSTILIDLTSYNLSTKGFEVRIKFLSKYKCFVFNLNGYPNFDADKILAYFIKDTLETSVFNIPLSYSNSNSCEYKIDSWKIFPKNKFNANLVFLSGNTFSFGESILEMIKYYKLGTIIGEISGGYNGDVSLVYLPIGSMLMTGLIPLRNGYFNLPVIPDIEIIIKNEDDLFNKKYLNSLLRKESIK